MNILHDVYLKILNSYPIPPPEQGGILGMKNGVVCEYFHDDCYIITDKAIYQPNISILNRKIAEWDEQDIQFAGMIHSHLSGQNTLSSGDKEFINFLFSKLPEYIDELYFPIIIPEKKQFLSFVAKRKKKDVIIKKDEIHIVL